jgi:hypothetical protein
MTTPKKKLYPAQVHILHSMIHMVKNKLKFEKWMADRDFVEANTLIFERMGEAIEERYRLDYTVSHAWEAARLFLDGRDRE